MNFTRNDMAIIVSMSIALIVMTFAFPAAGMVDEDNATENDIPEFDIDSNRFDFAGDFPRSPGAPATGTLIRVDDDPVTSDANKHLHGDTNNGVEMTLFKQNGTEDPHADIVFTNWTNGNSVTDNIVINDTGTTKTFQNYSYTIEFTYDKIENNNQSNVTLYVDYLITEQPENKGWISRIPILGTVVGAGQELAGVVGWIGGILFWTLGTIFEIALNLIGILLDVMVFLIATADWLIGTWTAITAGAGAWAKVFVAIPSILLFLEFAKLVAIGLSLLPTT